MNLEMELDDKVIMVTFVVVDNLIVDDDIVAMVTKVKSFLLVDFSYFQKQSRVSNVLFDAESRSAVSSDDQLTD